jgi:hypothetical protein
MMMMKKSSVIALALLAILAGQAHAQLDPRPAVTPADYALFNGDGPWTLGYTFRADQSAAVTALGAFDWDHDGFAANHQVGLWDENGNLLASTSVASGDTLIGDFRYNNISAVNLTAGSVYYVGASNFGVEDPYGYDGTVTTTWGISYLGSAYVNGSGLDFPIYLSGAQTGYYGGNLLVAAVPEPETYAMMAAGLGLIGLASRRKRARNAA